MFVYNKMDLRRLDPDFVDYRVHTAKEAIELFYKLKRKKLIVWADLDRHFQKLCKYLPEKYFSVRIV